MQTNLSEVQTVIWDFDGVFYDYTADFYQACVEANSAAACDLITGLDKDEAISLVLESYTEHHDCFSGLLARAQANKLDTDQFRRDLQTGHHRNKYQLILERCPDLLTPKPDVISAFEQSRDMGVTHLIATHSCKRHWALPALSHMGLSHIFPEDRVMDYADFDFENKGLTARAVTLGMHIGGTEPHQTAFVEDGLSNLHIAKEEYPTMFAALKTSDTVAPAGIDVAVDGPMAVLTMLIAARDPRNALVVAGVGAGTMPEPF